MKLVALLLTLVISSFAVAGQRVSATPEQAYSAFSEDPHRQFDFWIGEWGVNLRMIDDQLDWHDRVRARASIYSILGGKAILELWDSEPIKGYSLRHYDPREERWVLWLNWPGKNSSRLSRLYGGFRHGRGDFSRTYVNAEGQERVVRFSFNDITPFSLRWDDLHSADGGRSWGMNWRMEFNRVAIEPRWPIEAGGAPTWDAGQRCDAAPFRAYEVLAGDWSGEIGDNAARLSARRVLDGCMLMLFLDIDGPRLLSRFMTLSFNTEIGAWELAYLDDDRDSTLKRMTSETNWAQTKSDQHSVQWVLEEDELVYRFSGPGGASERGRFKRSD